MQDKFWTPELWCEFLNSNPGLPATFQNEVNLFKSSKTKKEWEIVAFGEHFDGRILLYKLQQDTGFYRNVDDDCPIEYAVHQFTNANEFIHSVRRLSDGEVFSVGDGLAHHSDPITKIEIDSAWGGGIVLRCGSKTDADALSIAEKLPQAILTTVDGVEIFPGQEFFQAVDPTTIHRFFAQYTDNPKSWEGLQLFSTLEAAKKYNLDHAPLLSLNDVKEACEGLYTNSLEIVLKKATEIAKQKLNQ